jgi:hypothetical protein
MAQPGENIHFNQRSLSQSNRASNRTASDRETSPLQPWTVAVSKEHRQTESMRLQNRDTALEGETHLYRSPDAPRSAALPAVHVFQDSPNTRLYRLRAVNQRTVQTLRMQAESNVKAFGPHYEVCVKADHREAIFPDPQTGIALGIESLTGRNVRSNGRCSCVLQFTVSPALCGALHRPTSLVIHRSG